MHCSETRRSPTYEAYPRPRRPSTGLILEALHIDPASGASLEKDKGAKLVKPPASTSSALAKLTKGSTSVGPLKQQPVEKKETPQERLKRIMSKQLNKQNLVPGLAPALEPVIVHELTPAHQGDPTVYLFLMLPGAYWYSWGLLPRADHLTGLGAVQDIDGKRVQEGEQGT
ncbi:hypothetical protein C1H46_029600 [Malus baccata]|uniref:Uncharacterized protein n=1 Tax=Malus baccata TaxID=106549 RepID=A0A540LEW0_MALBA|nr:hypothetical protein C1H46_029600 [Malus baccata]